MRAGALTALVPASGWQTMSCGDGPKGPRSYDWANSTAHRAPATATSSAGVVPAGARQAKNASSGAVKAMASPLRSLLRLLLVTGFVSCNLAGRSRR